jgi:hypothetical protein
MWLRNWLLSLLFFVALSLLTMLASAEELQLTEGNLSLPKPSTTSSSLLPMPRLNSLGTDWLDLNKLLEEWNQDSLKVLKQLEEQQAITKELRYSYQLLKEDYVNLESSVRQERDQHRIALNISIEQTEKEVKLKKVWRAIAIPAIILAVGEALLLGFTR